MKRALRRREEELFLNSFILKNCIWWLRSSVELPRGMDLGDRAS